jgi:hypothetical protein
MGAIQLRTALGAGQFDEVQYLEAKIILKGERFTSIDSFLAFEKLIKRAAKDTGVDYEPITGKRRPQMREVLFLDTKDFRLYNHAFILRRRIVYEHGFLVGDPEIVFKFRHPDLAVAQAVDVTPRIKGNHRIKFKAEALPLKEKVGGVRLLYSHNSQFNLSQVAEEDRTSARTLAKILPPLAPLFKDGRGHVELVNRTAVVEVLLDLGLLDFGKGVEAPCNVAVWRSRGDERQLVGEFSFQCKFNKASDLHRKQRELAREFFCHLQEVAKDWIALGTTKTGSVYRLKGNPPQAHE